MANGISKNPLLDINKVYLNQIAEGSLKSLEKASVLAMSDKPEDQDKAREIKTRFDYQSMLKQKKAKKMKEDISNCYKGSRTTPFSFIIRTYTTKQV